MLENRAAYVQQCFKSPCDLTSYKNNALLLASAWMGRDEPGRTWEFLEHGGGGRVRRRYRSQLHEMFCLSVRAATVGNLHAFLSALQMKSVTGSETAQLVSMLIAKQLNCSKCWSEDHIPVASLWDVAVMAVYWKGDTLHWLDNWGVLYLLVHQKWRELGESVALWLCFSGSETWWGMA